jgi:hypothetical protein
MEKYNAILELMKNLEPDFEKFFVKGNKAAGTRIRKGMQDLKALAQDVRVAVQEKKGE